MSNTYGNNLKIEIFGASHAPEIGVTAEGLPRGFAVDREALLAFLSRRAPGSTPYGTPRKESDEPVFLSGIDENGILDGTPLRAVIYNKNQHSSDYTSLTHIPRPSHADFAALEKYGKNVDLRGGGKFSGRLTAPLCIVGGICLQYLACRGIYVGAHLLSVGGVYDTPFSSVDLSKDELFAPHGKDFPCLDDSAASRMKEVILGARSLGDSVGGIVECGAVGLPVGLGEHMFDGVENRISSIAFAIPAVKGIEFGSGFASASMTGSRNNDAFDTDGERIFTLTNHSGGILGGMTNGMPLLFRVAMKPTPSIAREQQSVDLSAMKRVSLSIGGRHDPCVAIRAVPVLEAACAIAITDMLLDPSNSSGKFTL